MFKCRTIAAAACVLAAAACLHADEHPDNPSPRVIAGFGSSVCRGAGDHLEQGGYLGRLGERLADRGWTVIDVSRNGDNTTRIRERWRPTAEEPARPIEPHQYLLPHRPGYALIGLSLGNEGIVTPDPEKRQAVLEQFTAGLQDLIQRCRDEGIQPVVVNCYPRMDFRPADYQATQRMNLRIHQWDVPSVNMLGALDDGYGRWATGFRRDKGHPHGGGYEQMALSIVPSLFEALEQGKPPPRRAKATGYIRVKKNDHPALSFTPDDPVHAYATAFWFRTTSEGTLARVRGHAATTITTHEDFGEARRVVPTDTPTDHTLLIQDGRLVFRSDAPAEARATAFVADGRWHMASLSQRCAQGHTTVYLDGQPIAQVKTRLIPQTFELGVSIPADLRDWFVWRAAISDTEAAALNDGTMIQSSLEVYAPMSDPAIDPEKPLENRAQSLSQVRANHTDLEPRND